MIRLKIIGIATNKSWSYVIEDISPIVQNTIACNCVCGFAIYLIKARIDDITPPIKIPDNIKDKVLSNFTLDAKRNTITTLRTPIAKANAFIEQTVDVHKICFLLRFQSKQIFNVYYITSYIKSQQIYMGKNQKGKN